MDPRKGGEFLKQVEDLVIWIEERLGDKPSVEEQTLKMLADLYKSNFDFGAVDSQRRRMMISEAVKYLKPCEFIEDRTRI